MTRCTPRLLGCDSCCLLYNHQEAFDNDSRPQRKTPQIHPQVGEERVTRHWLLLSARVGIPQMRHGGPQGAAPHPGPHPLGAGRQQSWVGGSEACPWLWGVAMYIRVTYGAAAFWGKNRIGYIPYLAVWYKHTKQCSVG